MRFTLRPVGKFCVVVTASLVLSACTFQSKQLNFFKGIFEETTVIEVKPTWQLNWLNKSREMYVIQIPDAFVFTDGADLSIWFDGWNIYRIENFRDGLVIANTVYVEKETDIIESVGLRSDKIVKLRVDQDQNPLSTDPLILCAPWFGERLVNNMTVFLQKCGTADGYRHENRIELSEDGMITKIQSWLMSEQYPDETGVFTSVTLIKID